MQCFIKDNSLIARIAAWKLGAESVAIVIGRTIHLHNASPEQFLANRKWVRHELAHIDQFVRYGFIRFITLYLVESLKNGYTNNRFEVEARNCENDNQLDKVYTIAKRYH